MPAGEVVRLKNIGPNEFVGKYDQNRYVIKAKQEAVVPKEAAWHWLGRWYTIDKDRDKARTEEWNRLRVLYGLFDDESGSEIEKYERNVPKMICTDLDGNEIVTVLDDPTGSKSRPVDTTAAEKELIDDQISALKREIAALTSAQAQADMSTDYEPSADEVSEDNPTKVPVSDGPRRGRVSQGS